MKKRLIFLFFVFLVTIVLRAQEDQIVVQRVPFENGKNVRLSHFTQDTTGLIWGHNYKKWYNSDGERIMEVPKPFLEDSTRFIFGWIVDKKSGNFYLGGDSIRVYNPYCRKIIQAIGMDENFQPEWKNYTLLSMPSESDSIHWARCFEVGKNGHVLPDRNVLMQSRHGQSFKPIDIGVKLVNAQVQGVTSFLDEIFYLATDTIFQYDVDGHLKKVYPLPSTNTTPKLIHVENDQSQGIWFWLYNQNNQQSFDQALYHLKPNSEELKKIPLPGLNGLEILGIHKIGEEIWAIGARMALYNVVPGKKKATDYSKYILQQYPELPYFTDQVNDLFQDRTGTIWITNTLSGVFKLSNTKEPFQRILSGKRAHPFCAYSSCLIREITSDESGNIYFGYDYGIKKLDSRTGALTDIPINSKEVLKNVYSLTYFNKKLYLNAMEIDPQSGNTLEIIKAKNANRVTHFIDQEKNIMWIADAGSVTKFNQGIGLYRYNFESKELNLIKQFERAGYMDHVSQFHLSPSTKTIFMATTYDGIYELDRDGNILQHLTPKTNTGPSYRCYSLFEDHKQRLWIGHEGGISRLDLKTKKLEIKPSLINEKIKSGRLFSLYPQDDIYLWIGTNSGLYRLNLETEEVKNFAMFPLQKQMEFNRGSTYQDAKGKLYFGSVDGIFVFHPNNLVKEARLDEVFPVQVARFAHFDVNKDSLIYTYQDLATTSTYHIYPKHRYFSIDVFVPDFRNAKQNTFTWKLEDYDTRWSNPTNSNTIRYDNLPPGNYTLRVQGGILPEYYESSERQFQIIVHQVWYKSWWAISLFLLTFLVLGYLIYRYQVNQQLEKAEARRLKELDGLKSRLYTNITHEFRTPLTVIMGMTNNIQGHSQEKKLITRNSKNLLRLINQLLDLSKLDSGSLKMDKIQGDIINYLQYLTESFYSMAKEKKIRLTFYPEVKELIMDYDETKIQHIVYNLLTNAIKFTAEGGKVILHLKTIEKHGVDWLQMKVSDTGIGISENNLFKIFDRFYQGEGSATRKEVGTGIGLALTKKLVEMMGGTIVVESQLGEGTDFMILLPVLREQDTPIQTEVNDMAIFYQSSSDSESDEKIVPALDLSTFNKSSETPSLLIIEDNRDVVTYIESILKKDYNIEIARNGQEGIDKALEMIPDIIISDVMMPEKNGYEVCQALKTDERSSHIPIILLTAKSTAEDRIEGLKEGADAYLTKPFNKEELFIRLKKLVEIRKSLQDRYAGQSLFSKPVHIKKGTELSLDERFLQKLIKVVEDRLDDPDLAVVHLCRTAQLSNTQVNRKLKALTGKTPSQFIRSIRLQKARDLLQTTDFNVSEIAYKVGFNDPNYFSRSFSEEFGHPPNAIRK
ncbi:MAG: ATP-binding protein [Saprospiraceae bacterium]|nr:ATP-binding protein [Saprospiraceae bacterium]